MYRLLHAVLEITVGCTPMLSPCVCAPRVCLPLFPSLGSDGSASRAPTPAPTLETVQQYARNLETYPDVFRLLTGTDRSMGQRGLAKDVLVSD